MCHPCWKSLLHFLLQSYPTVLVILKEEYHYQKLMNSRPEVSTNQNLKLSTSLEDFIIIFA